MIPRAGRDAIGGSRGDAIVIRVSAAPVEGGANEAVIALLARALRIPRSAVAIESGRAARDKVVSLPAAAAERLHRLA